MKNKKYLLTAPFSITNRNEEVELISISEDRESGIIKYSNGYTETMKLSLLTPLTN